MPLRCKLGSKEHADVATTNNSYVHWLAALSRQATLNKLFQRSTLKSNLKGIMRNVLEVTVDIARKGEIVPVGTLQEEIGICRCREPTTLKGHALEGVNAIKRVRLPLLHATNIVDTPD